MSDIFEALSQIRKTSGSQGSTAVAEPDDSEVAENPRPGDIFSALDSVRAGQILLLDESDAKR